MVCWAGGKKGAPASLQLSVLLVLCVVARAGCDGAGRTGRSRVRVAPSDGSRVSSCSECAHGRVRLLHVTRHGGLQMEVQATVRGLCCIDVETFAFNDGVNVAGEEAGLNYNVHRHRAQLAWDAYGAWLQTFDAVLVSDVTAMSRPFLEHGFTKPLFIWVCNRFDFANQDHDFELAVTDMLQHGYFPDASYYTLMQEAAARPNVTLLQSNKFESHYAQHWRGIHWPAAALLYPAGLGGRPSLFAAAPLTSITKRVAEAAVEQSWQDEQGTLLQTPGLYGSHSTETLPPAADLAQTVLIPDRGIVSGSCPNALGQVAVFMNNEANLGVPHLLREHGFSVYHGRYDHAEHAAQFKAMVRIPNNYMTTAFHQLLAAGVVLFVPSRDFLLTLSSDPRFWYTSE